MVRVLIIIGLFLAVGFGLSYLHFFPNSYLLITLGEISIETSVAVAIGIVLVLIAGLWLIYTLLRGLISIPDSIFNNWLGLRGRHRREHLNQMLLAHLTGDERSTQHHLSRIGNHELGEAERLALQIYNQLQRGNPAIAVPLLDQLDGKVRNRSQKQLAMQLRATYWNKIGNYEQISNLALPARLLKQGFWGETMARAAIETGKWELLLKQLRANPGLGQEYWVEVLTNASTDDLVDKTFSSLPQEYKTHIAIARAYIEKLISTDRHKDAQNFLVSIANTPELFSLLAFVSKIKVHQPDKLLNKLENIYKELLPDISQLQTDQTGIFALALGRLCNQLRLDGKAEDYLQPLTKHTNHWINNQANLEMAKTLARQNQIESAFEHLQAVEPADSALQLLPSENKT